MVFIFFFFSFAAKIRTIQNDLIPFRCTWLCVQLSLGVIKQILMNVLILYYFFYQRYGNTCMLVCENRKHEVCSSVNFHAFSSCFYFYSFSFIGHFTHTFCIKSYSIPIFGDNLRYGPILNAVHILFSLELEGAVVLIFSSHNECIFVSHFHTNRIHMCSMYGFHPPQVYIIFCFTIN